MFRFLNGLRLVVCCTIVGMVGLAHPVLAAPISILSYNIQNAITNLPVNPAALGFFGHTNSYTGTITDTGVQADTGFFGNGALVNYSGGTGTLIDGNISSGSQDNLFFTTSGTLSSDPGAGVQSVGLTITLFLDAFYTINTVEFYGANNPTSSIPGRLNGVDIEVQEGPVTGSESFSPTTPFGPLNSQGVPVNDRATFLGTAIDGLVTDRLILTNFSSTGNDIFTITEILADGIFVKGLPAPNQIVIFLAALGLIGVTRARTKTL
ncbi:MAG: hypothetical protein GKS01_08460 [Alphaproteobacteria bacterium]|nr:hypothetical protein [Alphaproteobacteria bacterium]